MLLPTSESDFAASLDRAEEVLWNNGNPGRWLGIGLGDEDHADELFFTYSFGGRSDPSRDRTAVQEGSAIRLVAPGKTEEEMAEVPNAALVFYHASDTKDGVFVTSNGAQTRPVLNAVVDGYSFKSAVSNAPVVKGIMKGEEIDIDLSGPEPDPIETPRITGLYDSRAQTIGLAVVRKNLETGEPDRKFWMANLKDLRPGEGWAIQTYGENDPDDTETPVPHFTQPPYGFHMDGGTTAIAEHVREAVGERTFAAAVVRSIDVARRQFNGSTIINTRG